MTAEDAKGAEELKAASYLQETSGKQQATSSKLEHQVAGRCKQQAALHTDTKDAGKSMDPNDISRDIISAAMKVHSALGPGLLESAYEVCLAYELGKMGHRVERQLDLPVMYEGIRLDAGYRIDLLVDDTVVVELKAAESMLPVFEAQLLSYLKLSGRNLGLLINFKVAHLRQGIKRMVNHFDSSASSASSAVKGVASSAVKGIAK